MQFKKLKKETTKIKVTINEIEKKTQKINESRIGPLRRSTDFLLN